MSLEEKKFDIEKSCEFIENFVKSYRPGSFDMWQSYEMRTYLLDMLYGIGVSISDEYRMAEGFDRFKNDLIDFIKNEK